MSNTLKLKQLKWGQQFCFKGRSKKYIFIAYFTMPKDGLIYVYRPFDGDFSRSMSKGNFDTDYKTNNGDCLVDNVKSLSH